MTMSRTPFCANHRFPLIHKHLLALPTAEAADTQGQFWVMHDLLFENQDALEQERVWYRAPVKGEPYDSTVENNRRHY
jgi:protein-disulfide isomerase